MEDLTIPVKEKLTFGPQWFTVTQTICAILFIAQGIAYSGTSIWFPRFAIVYGVALLAAIIVLPRLTKEYSIRIDDQGIRGRTGYSTLIDLHWEDLALAEIKMFALILRTKGGGTIHIDLGELTYDQHKLVKPRLIDIFRSKGLLKEPAGTISETIR
jgi:hypothetical protein